jgi:hypothetical protein
LEAFSAKTSFAANASIREGTYSPSFAVGLLTRHLFDFKAFSLEKIEQWHFLKKKTEPAK